MRHRWATTLVAVLACVVTWTTGALLPPPARGDVTTAALTLMTLAGAACAARQAARSLGRLRLGWAAIAGSSFLWACGEAMWTHDAWMGRPFLTPTSADPLFAASGPLLVVGMALLAIRQADLSGRLLLAVDGLLVAISVLAVDWQLTVTTGRLLSLSEITDNALYVLGDVAALAVGLLVVGQTIRYRNRPSVRWSLGLLAAAGAAVQVGDGGYAFFAASNSYHLGNPIEVAYALHAGLLISAATLAPRAFPFEPAAPGRFGRLLAPVTAVASGALVAWWAIGASHPHGRLEGVPAMLLTLLLVLLGVRHGLLSRDLSVQAHSLDQRVQERTAALGAQERWFRALVQHASDVVTVLDAEGLVKWQSASTERVLAGGLVGRHFLDVVDAADRVRAGRILRHCLSSSGKQTTGSFRITRSDGSARHVETVMQSLLSDPDVQGVVLNIRDVTDRLELESKLADLAFHDPVTGLPNRTLFADRVEHALTARVRDGHLLAVLFCDLDGFKTINDTVGHGVGDQVLRIVGDRFSQAVRPGDTVARLGGDEYAVLLAPLASLEEAEEVATRVLEVLEEPIETDGLVSHVGASIGIAATDSCDETMPLLLRNADLAMYRAKRQGGRRWHRYEPTLLVDVTRRRDLEVGLRRALTQGELVVHYQPLVDLQRGRMAGVEALVRWQRDGALVAPSDFIPLAEETGLIVPLGASVLRQACVQAAAWQAYVPLTVSVNVSVRQLSPELLETVGSALRNSGLPPARLTLELTESALLESADGALSLVAALQELGVRIAIDDFGTGYSSLAYLSKLPVDSLKVDRSFVTRLNTVDGIGVVTAIVQMAQTLGLRTTAEGIEDADQLEVLRQLGVTNGQGYFFSRPVPGVEITAMLTARPDLDAAPAAAPAHS